MGRRKRYLEENGYICSATIQLQHHLGSSHLGTLGSEEQCLPPGCGFYNAKVRGFPNVNST
jgi:hypothetical protein